jgi:hypothetical protein
MVPAWLFLSLRLLWIGTGFLLCRPQVSAINRPPRAARGK